MPDLEYAGKVWTPDDILRIARRLSENHMELIQFVCNQLTASKALSWSVQRIQELETELRVEREVKWLREFGDRQAFREECWKQYRLNSITLTLRDHKEGK